MKKLAWLYLALMAGLPAWGQNKKLDSLYHQLNQHPKEDTVRVQLLTGICYYEYTSDNERNKLLGGARALLYPIQYPEAFGLVLIEAMLSGTPVVAMRLGAVPEIVDDGVTGYCADTPEAFRAAITRSFALDRHRIRQHAEKRFSAERMASQYAQVYQHLVATK